MKDCRKPGHRFTHDGYGEGICFDCIREEEEKRKNEPEDSSFAAREAHLIIASSLRPRQ